jgi:tetraacyldisaccharide 4'-kinase
MRRGWLARLLWPLSRLYGGVVAARRALYARRILKTTRLPVPVIVVGNVFVGGTGKTPLTIWLVDMLRQAGYTPGIVSRGHGRGARAGGVAGDDGDGHGRDENAQKAGASGKQGDGGAAGVLAVHPDSLPGEGGDEPVLIAQRSGAPVMVGRDRAAAGRCLLAAHPQVDVLVSDDGLQHYALERDIEIVLFDARGAGNGWLLPAGPLREPVARGRDFTIVNAPRKVAGLGPAPAYRMQLSGGMVERLADRSQRMPLSALHENAQDRDAPHIVAAAGIGNPARFFAMLSAAGLRFTPMPLPDHHDFQDQPFAGLEADIILITEKDAVKCVRIDGLKHDARLWVVPVAATLEAGLAEQILEKLRGYPTA